MYSFVLLVHSWLRYVVLGSGLWLLIASVRGLRAAQPWSDASARAQRIFISTLDTQFLLGLLLYFVLSPIVATARLDFGAAMKIAPLRFFAVEHIVTMFIAVAVAHIGSARAKRKEVPARYRTLIVTLLLWLLLTLVAIPWPGLDIGRPLFRL